MDLTDLLKKIKGDLSKNLASAGNVAIKANFLSNGEYPLSTSWDLFKKIIKNIRADYHKNIILIEPEFSDIKWVDVIGEEIGFLRDNNIKLVQANKESRFSVGFGKSVLYIPKSWKEADVRISISNAMIHKHHADIAFLGGAHNVSWLFTKTDKDFCHLKKDMYASGMELDYHHFISDVVLASSIVPVYSIVDAGKSAFVDEHAADVEIIDNPEYFSSSFSLIDADADIIKKLKIHSSHHHHDHHHG